MSEKNFALKFLEKNNAQRIIEEKRENKTETLNKAILKKIENVAASSETISKLISHPYYVYEDENIIAVVDEINKREEITAIAVLSYNNSPLGIIIKKEFLEQISKPFGRDIYKNKKIEILTQKKFKSFYEDTNILSIIDEVKTEMNSPENHYWVVIDKENKFRGLFTNRDILTYFSDITQKDLKFAELIQRQIVQEDFFIKTNFCQISAKSKMAKEVGGDFYLVKSITQDRWLISLFDISGKGISASLLTSLLGGMFSAYDFKNDIKQFLKTLNNYTFNTFQLEKYMTGIITTYDQKSKVITIFDMGHSFVYIFREKSLHKIKTGSNLPIGIKLDIDINPIKLKLKPKDILLIFSDGVIEQKDINNKTYSLKRISTLIEENREKDVDQLKNIITDDIYNFKKGMYQSDDITFILLKVIE